MARCQQGECVPEVHHAATPPEAEHCLGEERKGLGHSWNGRGKGRGMDGDRNSTRLPSPVPTLST